MTSMNRPAEGPDLRTHGGAAAVRITPLQELRRTVLSCMLWEGEYYENGQSIADRIAALVPACEASLVAALAIEARESQHLRHVPLLLVRELARHVRGRLVGDTLARVIQRPDEIAEFLSLYWAKGKCPLSKQVKVGLARAFRKFDAYQFAKYDQDNVIKLRDVLFMVHGKPKSVDGHFRTKHQRSLADSKNDFFGTEDEKLYRQIVDRTLPTPETWETKMSAAKGNVDESKGAFTSLLLEGKLGYMALLRNLRKMIELGVDHGLITQAIEARKGASKVLPFRFISAAREAPQFEAHLDGAFLAATGAQPKLAGKTIIVLDVSGSMQSCISGKSKLMRLEAGAALVAIARERCEDAVVYVTAGSDGYRTHKTALIPSRHGMALIDALKSSINVMGGGGIFLTPMMRYIETAEKCADRIIVVTDEQDCGVDERDRPDLAVPFGTKGNYLINVASYKNGIGYGKWTHIDGFSEATIDFIHQVEQVQP